MVNGNRSIVVGLGIAFFIIIGLAIIVAINVQLPGETALIDLGGIRG